MYNFFCFVISLGLLITTVNANAIIIRHDISDEKYQRLGNLYSTSVAYAGGCAATLISEYWLLTAAHCIVGREGNFFTALHSDKKHRIERMVVHPQFDKQHDELFDIALIQLKDPIETGNPVKIYTDINEIGQRVTFIGRGVFGNGKVGLIKNDFIQRGATNTIISASDQTIGFKFDSPKTATDLEGISSRGDSGGPALIEIGSELYVAGVSSFQERNGLQEGTYGVYEYYSRVSAYRNWINSITHNTASPSIPSHPIIDAIKNNEAAKVATQLSKNIVWENDSNIVTEAIYQSIILNRINLTEQLFKQGLNVKNLKIHNMSVFEFALTENRRVYFDMLLNNTREHKKIHAPSSYVLPLTIATFNQDAQLISKVKLLIAQGANINAKTPDGDTALQVAGWNTDNLDLINFLVIQGADINATNNDGYTPLMDAAALGKTDLLRFLLTKGADPQKKNKHAKTALDLAQEKNNIEAIKLLTAPPNKTSVHL